MGKWLRLPWAIGIAVVFAGLVVAGYWFQWSWTGFPAKTLWDWLQLAGVLAIPVAVGFGTMWFARRQAQESEAENADNQREAALQVYIDRMSELLLANYLQDFVIGKGVGQIAQVRTLIVLRRLDGERKGNVLQFLQYANLINKDNPIVHLKDINLAETKLRGGDLSGSTLRGANLTRAKLNAISFYGANLAGANFTEADLSVADFSRTNLAGVHLTCANLGEANFSGANLTGAFLTGADLDGANLTGANLRSVVLIGANLIRADLSGADLSSTNLSDTKGVTDEQLSKAKSLKGAIMPNGSTHP